MTVALRLSPMTPRLHEMWRSRRSKQELREQNLLLEHLAAEKLSYRDVFRLPLRIVRRQDVHLVAFVAGWYREPLKPIDVSPNRSGRKPLRIPNRPTRGGRRGRQKPIRTEPLATRARWPACNRRFLLPTGSSSELKLHLQDLDFCIFLLSYVSEPS